MYVPSFSDKPTVNATNGFNGLFLALRKKPLFSSIFFARAEALPDKDDGSPFSRACRKISLLQNFPATIFFHALRKLSDAV